MAKYKIEEIEGIGKVHGPKLQAAGIKTVAGLLAGGQTPKGRKELAEATGIDGTLILKWVNMADLFRGVKGIGPEYSELLEKAGIDTIKELRHRVAIEPACQTGRGQCRRRTAAGSGPARSESRSVLG